MNIKKPTEAVICEACALLASGDVIGMPTETVYGLAANALDDQAIAKIYAYKNRPQFNPLIIHIADLEAAMRIGIFTETALKLAQVFWPPSEKAGSITLVLPRAKDCPISLLATTGLETIAVRVPNHPVALALLRQCHVPLAAPSANVSNSISPTSAKDVLESLGNQIPLILEGGPCTVGLESTILDMTTTIPTLLRPGGLTIEAIEDVIGPIQKQHHSQNIKAPGMMKRHYAPSIPLRLNALDCDRDEALLGFGQTDVPVHLNLSAEGNLQEAAANLFRMLKDLDNPGFSKIAVAPIPNHGIGLAINDRLTRAAAVENSIESL